MQVKSSSTTTPLSGAQTGTISNLTGVIAIWAGGDTSYAQKSDGTTWAWGRNATDGGTAGGFNKFGSPTMTIASSWAAVKSVGGVGLNIRSISASENHALVLNYDGTAFSSGDNSLGQLGNRNTVAGSAGFTLIPTFDLHLGNVVALPPIDVDNDAVDDHWEMYYFTHLNANLALDGDSDGLTSLQEYLIGLNPNNPDTDGDGVDDGAEVQAGTDPNSAASFPPTWKGVESSLTYNFNDYPPEQGGRTGKLVKTAGWDSSLYTMTPLTSELGWPSLLGRLIALPQTKPALITAGLSDASGDANLDPSSPAPCYHATLSSKRFWLEVSPAAAVATSRTVLLVTTRTIDGIVSEPTVQAVTATIPAGATISEPIDVRPTFITNPTGNTAHTETVNVSLMPVDLAIDANRDNKISRDESASQAAPLRFWINNDSDGTGMFDTDLETEGATPDSQDGIIRNFRDLEDFQLLNVEIGPKVFTKIIAGEMKLGLKWKNVTDGAPSVKVYRTSISIEKPSDYLWNHQTSTNQVSNPQATSIATVSGSTTAWLPADALRRPGTDQIHPYLMFEGVTKGIGQLCLVFQTQNATTEVDGPGIWLKLMDVEEMFESAQGTVDGQIAYPNPPDYKSTQPPRPAVGFERIPWPGRGTFSADPQETNEAIIHVHGWNMTDSDRRTFSESFFKRLWWKGYKGRFASFAWPTYNSDDDAFGFIPDHYNKSEYVAWKFGPALKAYVDSITKGSKHVAAHSMGNVVAASALLSGLSVNSYVAMEAAIPSGCYDNTTNNYGPFTDEEQARPTPDAILPDFGYRGLMAAVGGNFHNFHSANDFALKTGATQIIGITKRTNWEANQIEHKPNHLLYYTHRPIPPAGQSKNRLEVNFGGTLLGQRDVTDPHEVMSFIARPRSEALGGRGGVAGFTNFDLKQPSLPYPFGTDRTDHSGQYQRPIQKTHFFFNTLLDSMDVGFNHLDESAL